jgi:poly(3-hydroxybutyrate) depolymerase
MKPLRTDRDLSPAPRPDHSSPPLPDGEGPGERSAPLAGRRSRLRTVVGLACLGALLAAIAAPADEASAPGDLGVTTGPDGALSVWLALGPVSGKESLDPPASAPREGDTLAGAAWTALASGSTKVKLRADKGGAAMLAAVLRSGAARRLYLATGSDVGLGVYLNGRELLRRDDGRRAQPDTDLVRLDLAAGDNLLALELRKGRKGPWSVFARLLDERFRAPEGIEILLPGAAGSSEKLLAAAAALRLERTVDVAAGAVKLRVALDFPGGRPIAAGASAARISFDGPGAPDAADASFPLGAGAAPDVILAERTLSGDAAPTSAIASFAGAKLKARVGVPMAAVKAIAQARQLLDAAPKDGEIPRTSVESAEYLVDEVAALVTEGDGDAGFERAEAERALRYARELSAGRDPLADFRGKLERLGYRSSVDGALHPYGLYVPPGWREAGSQKFGLVVALHGLNGYPLRMLNVLFGLEPYDDPTKLSVTQKQQPAPAAPMFVVAPEGFGNSNYYGYGEQSVLEAMARVMERYRIDADRVYITGVSMGGTGAAAVPLHYPDRFAAAMPLAGYHSVFEYNAVRGKKLEPWEKSAAARRSNATFADNGRYLPLHIVHGTLDSPRTSQVLVDRYRQLGYEVTFETPVSHHNVWDETYKDRWAFQFFRPFKRAAHPRRVTFTTGRLRWAGSYWVRVDDLEDYAAFAKIDATWREDGTISAKTANARAVSFLADEKLAAKGDVRFELDGEKLDASGPVDGAWRFHREGGRWVAGAEACAGRCKKAGSSGPIDDIWFEPLLFVYGTADPDEAALSRRLAEALADRGAGETVRFRVAADAEVTDADIAACSLVLVGTPRGNSLLARMQGAFPIRAVDGAIEAGGKRYEGTTVAAAFIAPNPLNPARYVLVHTGASREALFYSDHLPSLLPDWIVYDAAAWQDKGGSVLDEREALAAGFFDREWKIAGF